MRINFINKTKIKKHTFILCAGIIIGTKIISFPTKEVTTELIDNKPISEMTTEEKLETSGGVHLYFVNKEHLSIEKDSVSFFNTEGEGQGVVNSTHDDYIITFIPGNTYKFYIKALNSYGEFQINEAGEIINLIIDYQTMDYEMTSGNYTIGRK